MLNRARHGRMAGVVGAAGLVLLAGCKGGGAEPPAETSTVVTLTPADVSVATRATIESGPVISGTLQAKDEAEVNAQAAGTVTGVYAEQGQPVKQGQILARIESATAEQSALAARQAVQSAEQAYQVAKRQAERQATLVQAGAVAEQALETARSQEAAAQAQLANARAQLAAAQKQVSNTEVRAPIRGIVSARPVNQGDVVSMGTPLFTIVNPGAMKLEASVPSEQLGLVHVGDPVQFTVTGYPGREFTGRIDRINPAADPTTRQVPIFVTVPNEGGTLVSGLFAQGRVASQRTEALVVPNTAVDRSGAFPTVLQVTGGKVKEVAVKLGPEDPAQSRLAITSGITVGDTVLTNVSQGVPAGTPVRTSTTPAKD